MEERGDPLIGRRLREARERTGATQEVVADAVGKSRSHITNVELGYRPVGRETLMELAEFFSVPIDYFTSRDDLMATALWVLGRLPHDELEAWVQLMIARATRDKRPRKDS